MRYAAIDLETTGLDRKEDQILQIAAVLEDTDRAGDVAIEDLPTFEALIWHNRITGHPFALNMNAEIVEALAGVEWLDRESQESRTISFRGREVRVYPTVHKATLDLVRFFRREYGVGSADALPKIVAAGKNAGTFDLPFLTNADPDLNRVFCHRVIDVGSVALGSSPDYWKETRPPGMRDLHTSEPTHDAVDDARDVIILLRKIGGYVRRESRPSDAIVPELNDRLAVAAQ